MVSRNALIISILNMVLLLSGSTSLFAWGNPTHQMIAQEIGQYTDLPQSCYTADFVVANNAPDLFTVIGPQYAHSDLRFAQILIELAGEDALKRAYAYGYLAHMIEDGIVHPNFLPEPGIEHAAKEVAISATLYVEEPELREAGAIVRAIYYPDMLIEASQQYVEAFEGEELSRLEIELKAQLYLFGAWLQRILIENETVQTWAPVLADRSEWEGWYQLSIDSTYRAIQNAVSASEGFAEKNPVIHDHPNDFDFSSAGKLVAQSLGMTVRSTSRPDGAVVMELPLPTTALSLDQIAEASSRDHNSSSMALNRLVRALRGELVQPRILLHPPHPNPFNLSVEFEVEVKQPVHELSVEIIDVLGRRVTTLFSGSATAGRLNFAWQGRNSKGAAVASGVYFIRTRGDNTSASRKIILLK